MKFKDQFYIILAGIFIASLGTCNLIANKFVTVDLGFNVFIVSDGILPYPLTFLVTDLIADLYGQRKANLVVFSGFIASMFVLLFLWLGSQFEAIPGSIVNDSTYNSVFQNAWRLIAASMVAYLFAQFVDVRIFHFWKKLTNFLLYVMALPKLGSTRFFHETQKRPEYRATGRPRSSRRHGSVANSILHRP